MKKLIVFNHVSLDGYFVDSSNSMMWAKTDKEDKEWNDFVAGNAKGDGTLVFGRITYQMMASYWPMPIADHHNPSVAKMMNSASKIVFSRTLDKADWQNTRLIKGDLVAEMKKLKQESGEGMAILGSGTIVAQLAQANLIDEFQVVIDPIILGKGRTMFEGVTGNLKLKLQKAKSFSNGNVYLSYEPA